MGKGGYNFPACQLTSCNLLFFSDILLPSSLNISWNVNDNTGSSHHVPRFSFDRTFEGLFLRKENHPACWLQGIEFSTASELWLEPEARVFGYVIVSMVSLPNYMNRSLISWPWDIPMHKYLLCVCLHVKSLYQMQLFCEDENTLIVCHKVL